MGFADVTAEVELQRMLQVTNAIKEGFAEGILQAGKHIVDLASQLAPEDEGLLKASGEAVPVGDTVLVSFGNGLPDDRAAAQEYGTIYMPAQPYLGPAVKEIDVALEVAIAVRKRLT